MAYMDSWQSDCRVCFVDNPSPNLRKDSTYSLATIHLLQMNGRTQQLADDNIDNQSDVDMADTLISTRSTPSANIFTSDVKYFYF